LRPNYISEIDCASSLLQEPCLGSDKSVTTFLSACLERVFFSANNKLAKGVVVVATTKQDFMTVPQPEMETLSSLKREIKSLANIVRRRGPVVPLTYEQFVDRYTGRKRTIYANAVESLASQAITQTDSKIKPFTKHEIRADKKCPRVISPRSPRFNVELGRHLFPMETRIYWGFMKKFRDSKPVIMKGYDTKEVAALIKEKFESIAECAAIGLDAKRFDQHVSVPMLHLEHLLYTKINNSSQMKQLLKWQVKNSFDYINDEGRLKLVVEGKRMSGDVNTSLGNIIIMATLLYAYLKEKGLIGIARIVNNGDDSVVFLPRSMVHTLDDLHEWFLRRGFQMATEEPVYVLEQVEFCQGHVLTDGEEVFTAPKYTTLRKMTKICRLLDPLNLPIFRYNKASCMLAMYGGCPIYDTVARRMLIELDHVQAALYAKYEKANVFHQNTWLSEREKLELRKARLTKPITDAARISFFKAFGILPSEQEAIESVVRGAPTLSINDKSPLLRKLFGRMIF
jgi:hypothetical protein